MKVAYYLLGLLLLPLPAAEVEGVLNLVTATTSVNRFNVRIDATVPGNPTATDTRTTNASGFINTRLRADAATGTVQQLSFEGGDVALSNMNFNLRATVFFIPISVATLNTAGLRGFPTTPLPPAPVDSASGTFAAADHQFTINQGTVTGTVTGQTEPISADFADAPVTGPGVGTGSVILVPVSETASHRTFTATVNLPVSIDENSEEGVRIRVTGTLRAQGQIVVPKDPFIVWATSAGMPGLSFANEIRPGEPAGLVWAMGLQAADSLAAHAPRMQGGLTAPAALITLPAGGSAAPLTVEVSENLATGSWTPAAAAALSTGANPIPAGTQGPVTVELTGPNRFVRLSASAQ